MSAPGWFAAGFAAFLAVLVVSRFTHVRDLWRRSREDPGSLDDEWDPFR